MAKYNENHLEEDLKNQEYKYGFTTNIDSEVIAKGLNEDVIRLISSKKGEPQWLLDFRLKAFAQWQKMEEKHWAQIKYPKINFQDISYYAAPKEKKDVIFCSFSEAVKEHSELVKKHLGSVVPSTDNFYAALNSAVFSDGSFCYIPKGVRCPMELSTYFRINEANTGQFERTLLIADEGSYVSYLEGCTAPQRDKNQLHAAVVELIALDNAEIKYSTVQNWYPGDKYGNGGIYNFVTKRGICHYNAKISWTQVETGSAVTWKYPSCILKGDNSIGEFFSVAVTNHHQQADTGTKMIHLGKNTKSTIISKGISAGVSNNSYRGLVQINKNATNARNFSQCDSLLMGTKLPMEFAVEAQKLLEISLEGSVG